MRAFQSSFVGPEGFTAYTFQFEKGYVVPPILLEGDMAEVQTYLSQLQRLLGTSKDWAQAEMNAESCRAIEERIRFQLTEKLRAAEADRLRSVRLGEEVEILRTRLEEMRAAARTEEATIRERIECSWRERLGEIRTESSAALDLLRQQLEGMRAENRSLTEKLVGKEMALRSSQGRGRIGEDAFADAAAAACGWQLERSAGEARACDFKMRVANFDVRFEIKNHGTTIPGADIQKFYRDMEEHRENTGIGIFVALNVALAGRRCISHEWRGGQLLIFVSAFNDSDTDFIFITLRGLIDVYVRYRELVDQMALGREEAELASTLTELRSRIDSAMIHVGSQGKHLKELKLKLQRDKKSVVKMFDDSAELLASAQSEFDMTLRLLLGNAAADDEESMAPPSEEVPAQAPAPVPKKRAAPKRKTQSGSPSVLVEEKAP